MIFVAQVAFGRRAIDPWRTIAESKDEGHMLRLVQATEAPFKRVVKYDEFTDTIRETVYEYGQTSFGIDKVKGS